MECFQNVKPNYTHVIKPFLLPWNKPIGEESTENFKTPTKMLFTAENIYTNMWY